MFIQGSSKEVEAKIAELDTGRSILDAVADQVRGLERSVGAADRARLDQYFTSVRDLENRLQESKAWERRSKPGIHRIEHAGYKEPAHRGVAGGSVPAPPIVDGRSSRMTGLEHGPTRIPTKS
jgi:Protein of unknown function (DUF1552)